MENLIWVLILSRIFYTIDFYGEKKITLAIDKGQKVIIDADGNDLANIKISGSEDTAKFQAYEKFRRESLNRLVISVRNRLKATGRLQQY